MSSFDKTYIEYNRIVSWLQQPSVPNHVYILLDIIYIYIHTRTHMPLFILAEDLYSKGICN